MLLRDIDVGDMLYFDYIDDITGDMAWRPVLVLDTSPTHNVPNVAVLDRGEEQHVRSSQLWPIDGNDFDRAQSDWREARDSMLAKRPC